MEKSNYLIHHGIKGQRWGVRRFQNEDGTRTAAGKARERNGEQGSQSKSSSERRGLTDAELQSMGIRTVNGSERQEWNDQLKNRLVKGGYSYEDLGTAGGEHSRTIYKMAPGQVEKAKGVSNPNYYKRKRR